MAEIRYVYDRKIEEAFERAKEFCDKKKVEEIQTIFIVRELLKDGDSQLYEYLQEKLSFDDKFIEETLDVCIEYVVDDVKKKQRDARRCPKSTETRSTIELFRMDENERTEYPISYDLASVINEMNEYNNDVIESAIESNPGKYNKDNTIGIIISTNILMKHIVYNMPNDMVKFIRMLELKVSDVKNSFLNSNVEVGYRSLPTQLCSFLIDLTDECEKGKQNSICGRDKETNKVWEIFSKMNKKNAILVGEPGVGKTAIIQKIAQDIKNGKCPERFKDFRVLALDMTGIIAGTTLRGQAEERFKALNDYLEGESNLILFIDEIHTMMGAGACKEGELDLANSMKPILARGKAIVIGATTNDEYEKYFSRDGALKRRFEKVEIKEPKSEEIYEMLKVKIKELERFHGVKITSKMVETVAFTASCMQNETRNPDRTLDLIDKSMVVAKNAGKTSVDRESIIANYNLNFERFEKMKPDEKKSTAYHEAGHWLVHEMSGRLNDSTAIAISIIPAEYYLGITVYEESDVTVNKTIDYYIDYLAMTLAGREAEKLIGNEENAGVGCDLEDATKTAYNVITKLGMVDGYTISYFKDMVTETTAEKINQSVKELLLKAQKRAKELLLDNVQLLDAVANTVLKKKMVSKKELDKLLAKYTVKQSK